MMSGGRGPPQNVAVGRVLSQGLRPCGTLAFPGNPGPTMLAGGGLDLGPERLEPLSPGPPFHFAHGADGLVALADTQDEIKTKWEVPPGPGREA